MQGSEDDQENRRMLLIMECLCVACLIKKRGNANLGCIRQVFPQCDGNTFFPYMKHYLNANCCM